MPSALCISMSEGSDVHQVLLPVSHSHSY